MKTLLAPPVRPPLTITAHQPEGPSLRRLVAGGGQVFHLREA
jgi:hypothetical protein